MLVVKESGRARLKTDLVQPHLSWASISEACQGRPGQVARSASEHRDIGSSFPCSVGAFLGLYAARDADRQG